MLISAKNAQETQTGGMLETGRWSVKVGDLVKFIGHPTARPSRHRGIILSFDDDNDPVVLWLGSEWDGYSEANFRAHIEVLSVTE